MSTRILQISDTHFGTERPTVVEALLRAIDALEPQLLLLCGDITQRARRGQFAAARAFVDQRPGLPLLALPGNHDLPLFNLLERALRPYGEYERHFGVREQRWSNGELLVLGLDATHPRRHKHGQLTLSRLGDQLAAARAELGPQGVLVAAVHQPLWTALREDRGQVLRQAAETAAVFAANGVDVVLSGHVHVPLLATTEAAFPHLERHFVLSGSGTAVSWRFRPQAPNSFNLLEIGADSLWGLQYDFAAEAGAFVAVRALRFAREDECWRQVETRAAADAAGALRRVAPDAGSP